MIIAPITDNNDVAKARARNERRYDATAEAEGNAFFRFNQIRATYQKPLMGKRTLTLDKRKYE
jgi:hypothetical protein